MCTGVIFIGTNIWHCLLLFLDIQRPMKLALSTRSRFYNHRNVSFHLYSAITVGSEIWCKSGTAGVVRDHAQNDTVLWSITLGSKVVRWRWITDITIRQSTPVATEPPVCARGQTPRVWMFRSPGKLTHGIVRVPNRTGGLIVNTAEKNPVSCAIVSTRR